MDHDLHFYPATKGETEDEKELCEMDNADKKEMAKTIFNMSGTNAGSHTKFGNYLGNNYGTVYLCIARRSQLGS